MPKIDLRRKKNSKETPRHLVRMPNEDYDLIKSAYKKTNQNNKFRSIGQYWLSLVLENDPPNKNWQQFIGSFSLLEKAFEDSAYDNLEEYIKWLLKLEKSD